MELASRVSAKSWQAKQIGVRVRTDEDQLAFFESLAGVNALRSYVLISDGVPVAFMLGHQWNKVYVVEEIGYDAAYADFSPGTVLMVEAIDDLLDTDRPESIDFGFGDAVYKRIFANSSSQAANLLLVSRKLKAQGTLLVDKALAACKRSLKEVARRRKSI